MIQTFLVTLKPMLTLFICIVIGFVLVKTKILPEDSSKALAKLLTYAICPALSFSAMATNFTVNTLSAHLTNVILGALGVGVAITISLFLARFFVKDKTSYELGVYKYALTFGNSGYVGDPLVQAIFGTSGLAFYKLACLPLSIAIYTWGISVLVPHTEKRENPLINALKSFLNAPTIGLLIGMVFGITGLGDWLYSTDALSPVTSVITSLSNCMGPIAMILAGVTIARFDVKKMLANGKVYIATALRLLVLPTVITAVMFGVIVLANTLFGLSIGYEFLFLLFFAIATPLGMNTIVFPEAYGGDPSTGASMAIISHTLCVITIPLMFALLTFLFGPLPVF